ncbi:helix-turn-helix transcriptional regulator [Yoonia sp. I 8.24]|uniref:helix-turn-helix transcriptional regulator n=1 Tax=Yoonia sp. I 8.24 TaxID=1537229 RepID=UPI001F880511|nr:AlpA family phage regulatory protein [Yoonia sp. I 8.24]
MAETYLADTDLAGRYNIARNTVWRWHRENAKFPRAVRLSPNCTRWKLSEIEVWEATQIDAA